MGQKPTELGYVGIMILRDIVHLQNTFFEGCDQTCQADFALLHVHGSHASSWKESCDRWRGQVGD